MTFEPWQPGDNLMDQWNLDEVSAVSKEANIE